VSEQLQQTTISEIIEPSIVCRVIPLICRLRIISQRRKARSSPDRGLRPAMPKDAVGPKHSIVPFT